MPTNIIPIVFITDENYILPTAVSINSLIKNKNESTHYKIYILHNNLNYKSQNLFRAYSSDTVSIQFLEPDNSEYLLSMKDHRKSDYVSAAVLFKFAIPKLFKEYEKILYLDGDTIIMGDLSNLYNSDISDVYVGVVKDVFPILSGAYKNYGLDTYFNAGVILYNIKKILNDGIDDYLNSEEILNKTKEYYWFEQDTYNIVFNKNVKYLHPKYNFIIESWDKYGVKESSKVFDINPKEGKSLYKNALVFHLASGQKPWIYKNGLMRKTWEKYYKDSQFEFIKIDNKIYHKKDSNLIIQNIFSIKNSGIRKVITIFGLKIKIKSEKLVKKEQLNRLEQKIDNLNHYIIELKNFIEEVK